MRKEHVIILICIFCFVVAIVGTNGDSIYNWFSNWFNSLGGISKAITTLSQGFNNFVQKIIKFFS